MGQRGLLLLNILISYNSVGPLTVTMLRVCSKSVCFKMNISKHTNTST